MVCRKIGKMELFGRIVWMQNAKTSKVSTKDKNTIITQRIEFLYKNVILYFELM